MAWKNIPGKQYWQFKDDATVTQRNYLSRETSRRNTTIGGVRTEKGRQVYVQTRYIGPGSTDTDTTNRGEIDVNFHLASIGNAGTKSASFFSSLPAVGGGGGGGPVSDPNFANVLSLFKTPSDGSISDATGTLGPFIIGTGAVIDGTETQFQSANINLSGGGYVEVQGDTNLLDFGDDPFTIETWIYRTAAGTVGDNGPPEYDSIVSASVFGSAGWGIFIRQDTNRLVYERGDNGALFEGDANAVISNNTWTHVAVSSEGFGVDQNLRLFVNGVLAGTQSAPSGQNASPSLTRLGIGRYQADRRKRFIGHIEDLRLTKGVARYTEAFTPPTGEFAAPGGVVGLFKTPSVGSISDVTGTLGTPNIVFSAVVNSSRTKFQPAAINFTGTDGYIEVPYNGNQTSLDFGTGAFTVECWTYRAGDGTNGTGPYDAIMSTNINGSGNEGWGLFVKRAGQRVAWRSPNGPDFYYEDGVDFQLPLNAWAHVAVSSEGSGGNLRMFIDGVERFSVAAPTGNQNTSPSALNTAFQIGRQEDEQNRRYAGYVEDIRITKGIARYTATFTPPIAEFPSP